jgi:hypothetical protein
MRLDCRVASLLAMTKAGRQRPCAPGAPPPGRSTGPAPAPNAVIARNEAIHWLILNEMETFLLFLFQLAGVIFGHFNVFFSFVASEFFAFAAFISDCFIALVVLSTDGDGAPATNH